MNNIICYSFGVSTTFAVTYFLHTKARINLGEEIEHVLLNGHVSAKVRQVAAKTYSALTDIATTVKTDGVQSGWEKLRLYGSEARETQGAAPNRDDNYDDDSESCASSNLESELTNDEPDTEPEPDLEKESRVAELVAFFEEISKQKPEEGSPRKSRMRRSTAEGYYAIYDVELE